MTSTSHRFSRRDFLKLGAAGSLLSWFPVSRLAAAAPPVQYRLTAAKAGVRLAQNPFPETEVWTFNRESPGPLLRLRQGEPARIAVKNELEQPLTVHWHGLRIVNNMDGVPQLTQPPIDPGQEFVYEYTPPDAGTFWYHSHVNTAEQIGRGLYGPLIVEEREPYAVDREALWVLDDWRLDNEAQIVGDFDRQRDLARAGRLGNTVTVNSRTPRSFDVRAGERVRLRLLNAANARIFSLRFQGHRPVVIARDGQPLEPYAPGTAITIGPAQRLDLLLDMTRQPGERFAVLDTQYPQSPFKLMDIVYGEQPALRTSMPEAVPSLPANPIPEPDLSDPQLQPVVLAGGDLGRLQNAILGDKELDITRLYLLGKMWAINGRVSSGYTDIPLFTVERGRTVLLDFQNDTAWPHPMHLHGHHFKVVEHSSDSTVVGQWLDTVMLGPEERAKVAFVADNPGGWLFHCHILGHVRSGMMAVIRVG
jgi:FtsP/CotA-like multicopper oxidase with cupredoxin domain